MFPLFQWPASELAKLSACTAKCMNKIYIIYINKTVVKCCVDVPEFPTSMCLTLPVNCLRVLLSLSGLGGPCFSLFLPDETRKRCLVS